MLLVFSSLSEIQLVYNICVISPLAGKLEGNVSGSQEGSFSVSQERSVSVSKEVQQDLLGSNVRKPPGSKHRKKRKSSRLMLFLSIMWCN